MKTLNQIQKELKKLESVFGFNPKEIEQGSDEWHRMRLGVMSSSKAKEILSGSKTATRRTYIASLVGEIVTGHSKKEKFKQMEWGHEHEDKARAIFELQNKVKVEELPFVFKDNSRRCGISGDGFIFNEKTGVLEYGWENKCPFDPTNFIKFVCDQKIRSEHEDQCQFSMFVTGAKLWKYSNFEPRARNKKIHTYTFERDESKMKLFKEATEEISFEMDKMLMSFGLKFGDQWKLEIDKAA